MLGWWSKRSGIPFEVLAAMPEAMLAETVSQVAEYAKSARR